MAELVDLVVTGVTDSVSAEELSGKLVTEFGQPAETFTELVTGACTEGEAYIAQSSVLLNVAMDGQTQLEKLGLVCEIRSDQAALSSSDGLSSGQTGSGVGNEAGVAADLVQDNGLSQDTNASQQPDEGLSFEDALEELGTDYATARSNEIPAPEPSVDAPDEEAKPPGETGDELAFEPFEPLSEPQESLASDEIDAGDANPDASIDSVLDDSSVQSQTEPAQNKPSAADAGGLSLSTDNQSALASKSTAHAIKGIVNLGNKGAAGGELELSLDGLETNPKSKNINASATEAANAETVTNSEDLTEQSATEDGDGIADDVQAVDERAMDSDSLPFERSDSLSEEPTDIGLVSPEQSETVAEPPEAVNAAGTSLDTLVAHTAAEESEVGRVAPEQETTEYNADVKAPATHATSESGNTESAGSAGASMLGAIIANIESSRGAEGLVIPAQAEVTSDAIVSSGSTSIEEQVEQLRQSREEVAALQQKIEEDIEIESQVSSQFKLNGLLKDVRRFSAVAGLAAVVGGGGLLAYSNGVFDEKEVVPVVATATVDTSSGHDVEQNSLNAAIKRTAAVPNPEKFSTEELLVYLSDGLGADSIKDLEGFMKGGNADESGDTEPRVGAAIAADIRSKLWLKNRVAHSADQYFDEWSKRERDLRVFLELQERLIVAGDLSVASELGKRTEDKLFSVMSGQRMARAWGKAGDMERAKQYMEVTTRNSYAIPVASERVMAIADHALSEQELGMVDEALDSFLKVSILARNLTKPENRTVGLSAVATYFQRAGEEDQARQTLADALESAFELPEYTAARDLAIRHVALTEVAMGFTTLAMEHAHLIVDPFAAVSAYHGIALVLEKRGEGTNARRTINMAFRAGSLIEDSAKRTRLLEQVKLAGD